jgi:membrane peptidoglycan carboxypeptidase
VKGDLSYYFDFFVDLSIPDSLRFMSELKRHQFSVVSYGNNDLTRLNRPFTYTAYEKGEPVRTFTVGPENPNFRSIERISSFLKSSVLTSEDPSFYQHRGFLQDAFRESIITDIKERKFARGGSTISMQLVKNVFLNRNKTIARKFEEALLVWLIENQGLCTKDRMFEVYLNIIEWGPLVYGVNEAARFYFNKDAAKLNLAESIFLASIIPRPKWFKYSFSETGHLRDSQEGYFKLLSEKMLNRGLISQHDFDKLIPDVELKGPAKQLLKKTGPIPADSISYPDER